MSTPSSDSAALESIRRARQKRTITVLGCALIVGGLAVLLLLQRMPLPLRLLVGLMDVFAGLTLLVLVRQKFSGK